MTAAEETAVSGADEAPVKTVFVHAGAASEAAVRAAMAAAGSPPAVHIVEPRLVDPEARTFAIDAARYALIRDLIEQRCDRSATVILSCSVYNGVVPWLRDDTGIDVRRSDAAGVRQLARTTGTVGVLLSYAPSLPVVVDYLSERLAQSESAREIHAALAPEAFAFAHDARRYEAALCEAARALRDCAVVFIAQYSMEPYVGALQTVLGGRPLVSALAAQLEEGIAA